MKNIFLGTFTSRLGQLSSLLARKLLICGVLQTLSRKRANESGQMKIESSLITTGVITIMVLIAAYSAAPQVNDSFSPYVELDGQITLPTNFKENWTFLGAWTLPGNKDDGMHIVYTEPGVVKKFKETGNRFPDGAVLIKEVRSIRSEAMTTGANVIHAENETLWFVMIKDTKGRFSDNPNWGDGWGWALFNASDPSRNVSTSYKKDCLGCHIPAKQTDWIYTRGYPVLK